MRTIFKHLFLLSMFIAFVGANKAQEIKVITYNIRYNNPADGENSWPNRKTSVESIFKQYQADIYCLQEVLHSQLIDLQTMLTDYSWVGVGRDDGKEAGEHSPIFYKTNKYQLINSGTFWLSPTPAIAGSKGWDAALPRICTWAQLKDISNGKVFVVFNTHFDHQSKKARQESVRLILTTTRTLADSLPILFAGDLNSEPNSRVYKMILCNKKYGFIDSYQKQAGHCTFTSFNVNGSICKRLDFIFYNKHFSLTQYQIIKNQRGMYYPSDHLPVMAILHLQ
ncbi:MAG: endonuclease/exonuclease/phosphatase family protein [Bacteroidota bacterium]